MFQCDLFSHLLRDLMLIPPFADREEPSNQKPFPQPVVLSSKLQIPCLPLRWEQQSKLLPSVVGIPASQVSKWSTDEVGLLQKGFLCGISLCSLSTQYILFDYIYSLYS